MTASPSGVPDPVCGAPVMIPSAFTSVSSDTGRRCQRAAGHDGPHRWSAGWESASPAEVEADLAADYEKWDKPADD